KHMGRAVVISLFMLSCPIVGAQTVPEKSPSSDAAPEAPKDTLGRGTPRGTVLGLLKAFRNRNTGLAALYLNTPLRGADAEALASQLAAVIDRRLPARLNEISDNPEGSRQDPLNLDEDLIGVIQTANGNLDILVERVDRGKAGKVWLFSGKTLASIPDAFQELSESALERFLPDFMVRTRVADIPIFEWVALFVGMPFLYLLTGLLNRILSLAVGIVLRRLTRNPALTNPRILRPPFRLLLLALTIRWLVSKVPLPLFARQFWSTTALMIVVVACMWLLMLLNESGERFLVKRRRSLSGVASALRLVRRLIDGLIIFAGLLFTLHHFGINPTATLAGLGVGGIAVALAAQKTLENVIAGVSLIADQAVRVGDVLNLGDIQGTVEAVGLRSTRIRTVGRTLVSLPNGQIANMRLETLSVRDRFLFQPVVGLHYETTAVQLRSFIAGVRTLLSGHDNVDLASVRVRFVRFGASSLDVEIFAYVFASDWNNFLEIQEELLYGIMDIVQKAGAAIALPSQTLYLATDESDKRSQPISRLQRTK
ncbi:MAG TPA: mechanosensitive ion channel family protein, partial [Nitrospiraceae bacterium]|nr:mechanosensitive ion channel family protein [Nitrospiraceae bacterium]